MDSNYILTPEGELYHSGVLGMKWGIRRYQNKDGSLTPAGRKRYAKEEARLKEREKTIKGRERTRAKFAKLGAKKAELDAREDALKSTKKVNNQKDPKLEAEKAKSIKDMTDEELRAHTSRLMLEKSYYDAKNNLAIANPRKVSAGEKFLNGLLNDVIAPAAKNVGKSWLEKTLKDKLGLNQEDPMSKLKKQYEKLDWEKKIKDLKRNMNEDENAKLKREYEKLDWEKKIKDLKDGKSDKKEDENAKLKKEYEKLDLEKKIQDLKDGKSDKKEPSWDDRTKEQTYIKNQLETAKAQEQYEAYLEERRKRREQGDD